ncbi:MAG: glycosyltransferase [Patescibacteria group bacterium]
MKKKLIYLSHWRFPSEKTMTPLIMKTCEGFVQEGYDVELWIPTRHNPEFHIQDPFQVHNIKTQFTIRRLFAIDLIRFLGRFGFLLLVMSFNLQVFLRLLFADRSRTILYAHDVRDILFLTYLGYPTYIEIHDFYESRLHAINRMVFRHTTGLIVTNTLKLKHIAGTYGFPATAMIHQPNAVDYTFFNTNLKQDEARKVLGLPNDKRIILYTGHLFSWKGVETLALASRSLPDDYLVYFVGGTPHDREVLKEFVREHSLPRIEFLAHQDHARIPLFLKAADVLVLPNTAKEEASRLETSPVKLFEYMASGVPIVASDLPSIRDIVTDNEVQFFVADDPESLAEAIKETLTNPDESTERSQRAAEHAKRLSWEARRAAIAILIRETSTIRS